LGGVWGIGLQACRKAHSVVRSIFKMRLPGRAMKGTNRRQMLGAVVGKALEPLAKGTGVIQVLVTLQ